MSEQYAIALLGIIVTLYLFDRKMSSIALNGIAEKLDKINDSLAQFVNKNDCNMNMGSHCKRIDDLSDKMEDMTEDIIKLKDKHNL